MFFFPVFCYTLISNGLLWVCCCHREDETGHWTLLVGRSKFPFYYCRAFFQTLPQRCSNITTQSHTSRCSFSHIVDERARSRTLSLSLLVNLPRNNRKTIKREVKKDTRKTKGQSVGKDGTLRGGFSSQHYPPTEKRECVVIPAHCWTTCWAEGCTRRGV